MLQGEDLFLLSKYIGIPFEDKADTEFSADCFGLVRLIYKEKLSIGVFKPTSSAFNSRSVLREFLEESSRNWVKVEAPKLYDVVAMAHDPKHPNIIQHFGIYIGENRMIHTLKGVGSHVVSLEDYKYFIKGFYQWRK